MKKTEVNVAGSPDIFIRRACYNSVDACKAKKNPFPLHIKCRGRLAYLFLVILFPGHILATGDMGRVMARAGKRCCGKNQLDSHEGSREGIVLGGLAFVMILWCQGRTLTYG